MQSIFDDRRAVFILAVLGAAPLPARPDGMASGQGE